MRIPLRGSIAAILGAALVFSSLSFNSAEARSRHHNRNNAAVVGAVLGVFGTIAALAAADRYRERRYYGNPYYGPSYGAPYYPPVYRYRHRRHHHW